MHLPFYDPMLQKNKQRVQTAKKDTTHFAGEWDAGWYLMLTLTSFGLRALVVDADIVFLGDPLKEWWQVMD